MTSEGISARQANAAKPRSEQALAASRAATVRNWANPEFRDKRSLNQTTAWKDPTKRANMLAGRSVGIANSWLDPDVRERRIAGIRRKAQERALLKTEKDKNNAD